jgi:hypothetical protein
MYIVIPGRGNVTMEGVVMSDGVIGYERTSMMEKAWSERNPDEIRVFPETQIKNENRGTLSHLRRGNMPGAPGVTCTVTPLPPAAAASETDPDPSINWSFSGESRMYGEQLNARQGLTSSC